MARTKRPRTPSTGGRNDPLPSFPARNELAKTLVEAHLEGFLGRKRVHAFKKARLNQDLERCLKANWETLKKRMNQGEETVEFCFKHNYHEYEPSKEEVQAALPPDLKVLSDLEWAPSADQTEPIFKVTVTGVRQWRETVERDWVIGIEVDGDYLANARNKALTAALERGDDVERE